VLQGRRFTDGLQQAIEAKENLLVSSETQVVAKVEMMMIMILMMIMMMIMMIEIMRR
jgi:preprotein translocase subunit SecA